MQAIRELDDDDPEILRHREDHLPVVLCLRLLATLVLDPRQLRDAFHELGDLVAELGSHLVDRRVGVLDDVVQQRGSDRRVVGAELRQDSRYPDRMDDEVLAAAAFVALVRLACKVNARSSSPRSTSALCSPTVAMSSTRSGRCLSAGLLRTCSISSL